MIGVTTGIQAIFDLKSLALQEFMEECLVTPDLLVRDELIVLTLWNHEYEVVLTNKRVIVVSVIDAERNGVAYYSYPLSQVQSFGIEPPETLDGGGRLSLGLAGGNRVRLEFRAGVDVCEVGTQVAEYVL